MHSWYYKKVLTIHSRLRYIWITSVIVLCLGLFWLSLFVYSPFQITQSDVYSALTGKAEEGGNIAYIVAQLRVPRALSAMLVGMCLAAAGCLMQGITRNRLASPSLFGVTAGAALGMAFYTTNLLPVHIVGSEFMATLMGGACAWMIVFTLGKAWGAEHTQSRLILAGITVAALCLALTRLTIILVEVQAQGVLNWLAGSFANVGMTQLHFLWPFALAGIVIALMCTPSLNLVSLGQDAAKSLGVNLKRLRFIIFITSLVLVAATVVSVGPVGFVGLVAPNIARAIVGVDYRKVLPLSMMIGAGIVLGADIVSRAVAFPAETPAGIIVALIGTPFFLYLARRSL